MLQTASIQFPALPSDPLELLRAWPSDQPLMMLHSAGASSKWSRRSVFAQPQAVLTLETNRCHWQGEPPRWARQAVNTGAEANDVLGTLERVLCAKPKQENGFWICFFSYELGYLLEPKSRSSALAIKNDRDWPIAQLAWCPAALLHDNHTNTWQSVGNVQPLFESLQFNAHIAEQQSPKFNELRSNFTKQQYLDACQTVIDAIAAGDIFQANLTQRFSCEFSGSTRELALQALQRSGAWYGAYMELPGDRTICSLSPELFLQYENDTRRVLTRPIKGTRPAATPKNELLHSEKDAAELTMIIDLMRNDLGKVCEFGSVRVPVQRMIESHAGVHHGVGEVTGIVQKHCTLFDLLRSTMPAGSITGAPKIRAMQLLHELEPHNRGPYCGAIGMVEPNGNMTLNVAIRTMTFTGRRNPLQYGLYQQATLDYGAGGGIVADSQPLAEYNETLDKTHILRDVMRAFQTHTICCTENQT